MYSCLCASAIRYLWVSAVGVPVHGHHVLPISLRTVNGFPHVRPEVIWTAPGRQEH
jgi:hypothetical protein